MKLREAINHYVAWRRTHGAKIRESERILLQFCKQIDPDSDCNSATMEQVRKFLAGNGTLTASRQIKYIALAGFYRYAISRGYADHSPMPTPQEEPKPPPTAPPYVYSKDELHQLFTTAKDCQKKASKLDAYTFRTLLLLLYATGLRFGEAQRLALADVNLEEAVLTIRDTKFFKSRLVPTGTQITEVLKIYATKRLKRPLPQGIDSAFLAYRDGTPLVYQTVHSAFSKVLNAAGIRNNNDGRLRPCVHSFRHSFCVHRLTSWYREGADVQRLLPVLSTYLGHTNLNGTQVYLSMTPELLQEASSLFNQYVNGDNQ